MRCELKTISISAVVIAVLNFLDYVTTVIGLRYEFFEEANAISKKLILAGVFDEVKIGLSLALVLIGILAWMALKEHYEVWIEKRAFRVLMRLACITCLAVTAEYFLVVLNNVLLLLLM